MSGIGPGNCDASKSEVGADGQCYAYCPVGWSPLDNGPMCAKDCPQGFGPAGTTDGSTVACLRPAFSREIKPTLSCPPGADRLFDKCLLDCPLGTHKKFNLCVPDCPVGFVETPDGLSCQAEFMKRTATVREACYANETRIAGRICLGPCDAGTVPLQSDSEMCFSTVPVNLRPFFWTGDPNFASDIGPLVAKVIFARATEGATCATDFVPFNGRCFAKCPTGSTDLGLQCVANCPSDFKSIGNQSACLRPTMKRAVVKNVLDRIGDIIKKIFYGILAIMGLSIVASIVA
jgi:hypothetical protein